MKGKIKELIDWADEADSRCRIKTDRDMQNFEYLFGRLVSMVLELREEEKKDTTVGFAL